MANELPSISLKAIGIVRNGITQLPGPKQGWREVVSDIVINSSLTEALDGLEEYSHIIALSGCIRLLLPVSCRLKDTPGIDRSFLW